MAHLNVNHANRRVDTPEAALGPTYACGNHCRCKSACADFAFGLLDAIRIGGRNRCNVGTSHFLGRVPTLSSAKLGGDYLRLSEHQRYRKCLDRPGEELPLAQISLGV